MGDSIKSQQLQFVSIRICDQGDPSAAGTQGTGRLMHRHTELREVRHERIDIVNADAEVPVRADRANGQGGLVPQLELHASPIVLCRREKDQRPRDLRKGDAPLLA